MRFFFKIVFIKFLFLFLVNPITGQEITKFSARLHLGVMYYQGDLAPKPIDLSFGPGNLSYGTSIGYNALKWASINLRYIRGRISGDDAFSSNNERRDRNLSFASGITEYGLFTDIRINKWWKSLNKYKIKLYVSAGLNLFRFNPKAYYQGEWVELQPLGTEGQNIPKYGKEKYNLTAISRPIGLILEFDFSPQLAVGIEIIPRKTYTDYLDDVSGTYASYEDLLSSSHPLAANLASRRGEGKPGSNIEAIPGSKRGNSNNNDWYTVLGLNFKYNFGKRGEVEAPPHIDMLLIDELKNE